MPDDAKRRCVQEDDGVEHPAKQIALHQRGRGRFPFWRQITWRRRRRRMKGRRNMWFSHGHSIHQPSTTVMPMQPVVHSRSPNIASRSLLYQRWLVDRFPTDDEEDPAPRALGADPLHFQSLDLEPLRSDKRLLPVVFVDSRSYHDRKYEKTPGLEENRFRNVI